MEYQCVLSTAPELMVEADARCASAVVEPRAQAISVPGIKMIGNDIRRISTQDNCLLLKNAVFEITLSCNQGRRDTLEVGVVVFRKTLSVTLRTCLWKRLHYIN